MFPSGYATEEVIVKIYLFAAFLLAFFLAVALMLCTKGMDVIFMGSDEWYHHYGFPWPVFIFDSRGNILHIYNGNIIANAFMLSPFVIATWVGSLKSGTRKINYIALCISAFTLAGALLLSSSHKKASYLLCLGIYLVWVVWFAVLVIMNRAEIRAKT